VRTRDSYVWAGQRGFNLITAPFLIDVATLREYMDVYYRTLAEAGHATEQTRPLFADPAAEMRQYVEQTGVIPINTVFVLKQATVERYPDLAPAVLEMTSAALAAYTEEIDRSGGAHHTYVPVALARELGRYPCRQGLDANRAAVQMMIVYCYEQGLINTLYRPEDLFVASCV
jgi:hypothetical protein